MRLYLFSSVADSALLAKNYKNRDPVLLEVMASIAARSAFELIPALMM